MKNHRLLRSRRDTQTGTPGISRVSTRKMILKMKKRSFFALSSANLLLFGFDIKEYFELERHPVRFLCLIAPPELFFQTATLDVPRHRGIGIVRESARVLADMASWYRSRLKRARAFFGHASAKFWLRAMAFSQSARASAFFPFSIWTDARRSQPSGMVGSRERALVA